MKRPLSSLLLVALSALAGCSLTAPPLPSTGSDAPVAPDGVAPDDVTLPDAPVRDDMSSPDAQVDDLGSRPDASEPFDVPSQPDVVVGPDATPVPDVPLVGDAPPAPDAPPPPDAPVDVVSCGDTATDPDNCGACGNRCVFNNASARCVAGVCMIAMCLSEHRDCDGNRANGCETRIVGSLTNCGRCGNVCPSPDGGTAVCRASGICGLSIMCTGTMGDCDGNPANGCEVEMATSSTNCGMCGRSCAAPNVTPRCERGVCANTCVAGFGDCDENGANGCETRVDSSSHCGACGRACSFANAGAACTSGACAIGACNSGFGNCDGVAANGCEARLDSVAHCGACGRACSFANASAACAAGACALGACNPGFGNCDGNPANGCETSLNTNSASCGTCGRACSAANASVSCVGGVCVLGACNGGFGNCDSNPVNGCETSLTSDPSQCGACGRTCGAGELCNGGVCRATCSLTVCGSACVDTASDVNHCGACGARCAPANATPACASGRCLVGACLGSFSNCDGDAANGCEVNVASAMSHCGRCGNACAPPNAAGACASGVCGIAVCLPGFSNCDGAVGNGCEVSVASSVFHCGMCGNACAAPTNGVAACRAGVCGFTCNTGYVSSGTGCVACGGYGQPPCPSGCTSGLTDCSSVCRDLLIDRNNCGACGRRCLTTQYCEEGICARACSRPPCPEP